MAQPDVTAHSFDEDGVAVDLPLGVVRGCGGGSVRERFGVKFAQFLDPGAHGVDVGQQVTMGVRPEDVHLERDQSNAAAATRTFNVVTDVLEPMGDEQFVYLLMERDVEASAEGRGEGQLLMSVGPDEDITEEEEISVVFDREKIHLFDTNSGDAIVHGLQPRSVPEP